MAYRNKTYIIFASEDIGHYRVMRGWKVNKKVDFDFHDAHDLNVLTDRASDETVYRKLRERFSSGKQAIVLIGEMTRRKHKFVRWEMQVALELEMPIVAVNLNGKRSMDPGRCPPVLRGEYVIHVPYRARIIKWELDNFPPQHARRDKYPGGDWYVDDAVYQELGLSDSPALPTLRRPSANLLTLRDPPVRLPTLMDPFLIRPPKKR
jgi:hypothetical protein